jgi:hypothetical protein
MILVSFAIAEGNPGALTFLVEAYAKDPFKAERGFQRMRDAGITGSRLYMLWNDCCNRDTEMAMDIMSNKAIDVILHHIDGGRVYGIPFEKNSIETSCMPIER